MNRGAIILAGLLLSAPLAADESRRGLPEATKALGDINQDLVFKPLTACRIVDTRVAGGPIGPNASRALLAVAVGSGANFTSQGGSVTDCGTAGAGASAVLLNVTVIAPTNAGSATVHRSGETRPAFPTILYEAGAVQSGLVMTRIPNPLAITDFILFSEFAAHYTVDIVGLFTVSPATAPQCVGTDVTTTSIAPGVSTFVNAPACPAGYVATTPYCFTNSTGVYSRGSGINSNTPGLPAFCAWVNTTPAAQNVLSGATCCRVPGR